MVQEGFAPAAPLAQLDLSQSNVEGNQLKQELQITWSHTNGGFSPLGPECRDYLHLPRLRVGVRLRGDNGQSPPSPLSRSKASASLMPNGADPQLVPDLRLAQYTGLTTIRGGKISLPKWRAVACQQKLSAGYCPKSPPLIGLLSLSIPIIAIIETLAGTQT